MRRSRIVLAALLAGATVALGAHLGLAATPKPSPSAHAKAAAPAKPKCSVLKISAPNTLAGLKVSPADPCSTFLEARGDRALDAVSLLTVRQSDDLLIATLEVGRFSKAAPVSDRDFRAGVIESIGDVAPRSLLVGKETVYTSSSPGLVLVTWIRGHYLYVLAIRQTFGFPKALLRDALKVQG
jgi:hypothetical protein